MGTGYRVQAAVMLSTVGVTHSLQCPSERQRRPRAGGGGISSSGRGTRCRCPHSPPPARSMPTTS